MSGFAEDARRTYYGILGLSPDADAEAIEAAYRELTSERRPDRDEAADARERFAEIDEAYEALRDPGRRAAYDRDLAAGPARSVVPASGSAPASRPWGTGGVPAPVGGWWVLLTVVVAVGLIIGITLIGLVLLAAGVTVAGENAINILDPESLAASQEVAMVVLTGQAAGLIGAVYLIALKARGNRWRDLGLRRIGRRWFLAAVLIGLACILVVTPLAYLVQVLLDRAGSSPQMEMFAPEGFTFVALVGTLLLGGIVIPFGEELFFRGLLYGWARGRWGVAAGTTASALVFGVVHMVLEVMFAAAVMGVVLALVYERSRSLWAPIAVHMTFNLASLSIMFAMLAFAD